MTEPFVHSQALQGTAWAAGLFEGEGSILFGYPKGRTDKRPRFSVTLTTTDIDVLQKFAAVVKNGNIRGPYNYNNPVHKPFWVWTWCGIKAIYWLRDNFEPFLGNRRRAKLEEVLSLNATAPYCSEGFRRWAQGIHLTSKQCSKCHVEKPRADFSSTKSRCRQCCSASLRDYRLRRKAMVAT